MGDAKPAFVGASEKEIEVVARGKVDPVQNKSRLDGLLDCLLGVEADDVVLHVRLNGKALTGTKVALGSSQQDSGDLALLRTGR